MENFRPLLFLSFHPRLTESDPGRRHQLWWEGQLMTQGKVQLSLYIRAICRAIYLLYIQHHPDPSYMEYTTYHSARLL